MLTNTVSQYWLMCCEKKIKFLMNCLAFLRKKEHMRLSVIIVMVYFSVV